MEQTEKVIAKHQKKALLFFIVLLLGCVGARQTIQITDYILVQNGIEVIGNTSLTAFVFENNHKQLPIELYLAQKFKTSNFDENEFWVNIENEKFKIIIYDYADFEKYINSANYAVINLDPENEKNGDKRDFIAISMINRYNEDCLLSSSIYQNMALNYLRKLKKEYCNQ